MNASSIITLNEKSVHDNVAFLKEKAGTVG